MLSGVPDPELPWEQGFPPEWLLKAIRQIVAAAEAGEVLGPFFAYVIIRASDGMAVGDAGFHGAPDENGELEIGYALVPAARSLGLASEAVRLLVSWASTQPGVNRVFALVDPRNAESQRLLTRMNFEPDGRRGSLHRFVFAGSLRP
jgi:RimJ/RimL family protein N-acetyltransferase